jgi:hypothetical protein
MRYTAHSLERELHLVKHPRAVTAYTKELKYRKQKKKKQSFTHGTLIMSQDSNQKELPTSTKAGREKENQQLHQNIPLNP